MQFLEFKNSASPLSEMEVELKFKLYIFSRLFELAISIKAASLNRMHPCKSKWCIDMEAYQ